MCARGLCGKLDLLIGRVGSAVPDILAHRARKQMCILKHHCDILTQRRERILADILTVYRYCAAVGIVETAEQIRNGGLARARRTDECDLLSRHCVQ